MKRINLMVILFILCVSVGHSFAQTAVKTPIHKAKNPAHHQVYQRIRQEIRQIAKDEKSGKITHAQAQVLKTKLKSVHDQQKSFTRQNKGADLTGDQAKQLNQSLDGMASSH